jgi:leucyl-tRNA synthetase
MSKSLGNTVDPNNLIDTYGADTARLFVMFASPPEQSLEWSDSGVEGTHRFLKRLWNFAHHHQKMIQDINQAVFDDHHIHWNNCEKRLKKSRHLVHQTIAQIKHDYDRHQFNTVVSGCMKIFNEMSSYEIKTEEDSCYILTVFSILLRLLAPITPHICHHLWIELGFDKAIIDSPWPKVDKNALKTDEVEFIVQVNGKLRAHFTADTDSNEDALISSAKVHAKAFIDGKDIKKAIVVSHRQLINLVVSG